MRNQSKKFRTLIAFGETPDRWQWEIKNLAKDGDLLDPEAHSERLMGLWKTRETLIPELDGVDHALDYLDELENEGGNVNAPMAAPEDALKEAAALGEPVAGGALEQYRQQITAPVSGAIMPEQAPARAVLINAGYDQNQIGDKAEDTAPDSLYEGWPEDHPYRPETKAVDPCQHAKNTLTQLGYDKEYLRAELARWDENLKAMGPILDEAMDNLEASIGAAAVTAAAAPSQGLKGLADVPLAVINVSDRKQEQDAIVAKVMYIRGEIDKTLQDIQQNNKDKVMVYDKQETLNCP